MFAQFPKKTLFWKFIFGIVAVSFIITSVPVRSYANADKLRTRVADNQHAAKAEEIREELKLLTQAHPAATIFAREPARPLITPVTKPEIFVLSNKISLLKGAMTGGYNIGHAIGENADGGVFNHSEWRAMLEGSLSAILESLSSVTKHEVVKGAVVLSVSAKKDYIERVKRLTNLPEKDIEEFLPEIQKHLLYAQTAQNLQRQIETLARRIVNKTVNNLLKEVIARSNTYPFKQTVLCVGESKAQYDAGRTNEILEQDLKETLDGITQQDLEKINLRVAYEARWVIGKGVIPPEVFAKINEIHGFIEQVGKDTLKLTLSVDYGASVNKDNIAELARLPKVAGFLIGGAAKSPEQVGQMIDILNSLGLDKIFNFGMNWKAEGEETGLKSVNEFVEILKAKDLSKVQIAISTPNVAPVKNAVAALTPAKLPMWIKFSSYLSAVSGMEEIGPGYSKGIIASSEKIEQLEKLFGEKTKKGDTYFIIGKNNAYFALAKENNIDQTLTVLPTVDLSNPAGLEAYYSSLLEYVSLVTTKSQKGLELINIAGDELKLKSFLTNEGAEVKVRPNSPNIVEENFASGNLIGKKRWMGTGLLRDKFFQFEYSIGSSQKGVRPTLLTFKRSKNKLTRGWSAIVQPKYTHLIFGFGTIGSEVGKKSREMGFNVVAVNRSPNEKAGLAQSLGVPLYLLSADDKKAFEKAKIGAEGILEDLLKNGGVDLITDATDGETKDPQTKEEVTVAAYNTKYIYSKYPKIKVMYEGAEDPKIANRFFDSGTLNVLKIPYSKAMEGVNSLFFPSCNTTGQGFILDRVTSNSKDLVVRVTTGRRANDPGQKGKLSPDGTAVETGYHHAEDYLEGRQDYSEIINAFRKGAKNKPSLTTDASNTHLTKFHITEMWISGFDKNTGKRLTAESVKKFLSEESRIALVDFKKDKFDATLLIDILFNKLSVIHPFTPIVQVLDLLDSGDVKITLAVPQESIVIPNNMNGIHALTGLYEREASTRLVNDVMQLVEVSQAIESTLPLKSARVKTKESKEVEIPAIPGIVTYTNKQLEDFKSPDGKPVYATLNTDVGDIENEQVSDKQDKKLIEGYDYLERLSNNNALYILGHNGRPAGKYVEKLSLFAVAKWYAFQRAKIYGQGIEEYVGEKDASGRFIEASYWIIKNYRGKGDVKVWFLPDIDNASVNKYAQIVKDLKPGDWAIPENRRMDSREQAGDPAGESPNVDPALREAAIKDMLYRGGEELLVGPIGFNFGTADVHRYDARITDAGKFLLLASGQNTADFIGRVNKIRTLIGQAHEKGAAAFVVSGLKKDKIELLLEAVNNILQKGDKVVVVGAINAYPLAAEGKTTGKMEIKKDTLEMWKQVVEAAKTKGIDLYYPKALKVVKDLTTAKKEDIQVIQDGNIPEGYVIGDVADQGLTEIFNIFEDENVKLVLQSGPVGPFDLNDVLAEGSNQFQQKLAELSLKKKVVSLGSDTQKANKKAGVDGKFPDQYTDGGSFLDALTSPIGKDVPAIAALKESAKIHQKEDHLAEISLPRITTKATDTIIAEVNVLDNIISAVSQKFNISRVKISGYLNADKTSFDALGGKEFSKLVDSAKIAQEAPLKVNGKLSNLEVVKVEKISDSRGKPTVRVVLRLGDIEVKGEVPAGASKGADEAKTVDIDKAVANVNALAALLKDSGLDFTKHEDLRQAEKIIAKNAGSNFERLGANATVPFSWALWRLAAKLNNMQLWEYIRKNELSAVKFEESRDGAVKFFMNIYNGGLHALKKGEALGKDRIDIQEIMIVPVGAKTHADALRMGDEIDQALKKILEVKYIKDAVTRADEAGFSVKGLGDSSEAIGYVLQAIKNAGYKPGEDVKLALDVAATTFYNADKNEYLFQGQSKSSEDMVNYYLSLVEKYPGVIVSIEDGLAENDWAGWIVLTHKMKPHGITTIGDDLFVTQMDRLENGISNGAASGILIKVNQNGLVGGTLDVIKYALENGLKIVVSHRSGETLDDGIADLAYASRALGLKTGDPQPVVDFQDKTKWVRRNKYLRMVEIQETKDNKLEVSAKQLSQTVVRVDWQFRGAKAIRNFSIDISADSKEGVFMVDTITKQLNSAIAPVLQKNNLDLTKEEDYKLAMELTAAALKLGEIREITFNFVKDKLLPAMRENLSAKLGIQKNAAKPRALVINSRFFELAGAASAIQKITELFDSGYKIGLYGKGAEKLKALLGASDNIITADTEEAALAELNRVFDVTYTNAVVLGYSEFNLQLDVNQVLTSSGGATLLAAAKALKELANNPAVDEAFKEFYQSLQKEGVIPEQGDIEKYAMLTKIEGPVTYDLSDIKLTEQKVKEIEKEAEAVKIFISEFATKG